MIAALLLLLAAPVERAVERDGTILEREELVLDAGAGVLRCREREYPLDGFYLVEGENGACLWAPDLASRLRGYELLARERVREEAGRLFRQAIRYRDAKLARSLFEVAQDHGLDGKDLEKARKRLRRLEEKPGEVSSKAKGVQEAAQRLRNVHADLLFSRAGTELRGDDHTGLVMLREVLRLDPRHAGALATLAARAPADFALGDAAAWLAWHLDVERTGARLVSNDGFAMRQALKYWRPDLHGIEVGPVLVITPVADARVLGRMLGCCRLVTDVLASQFAAFPKRRTRTDPLRIFLFENKEEYKRGSKEFKPTRDTALLEFTAGHYSPDEGISRLYWVTDRDAENRIIGAAVHELTHHWLAEANPAYNRAEGRRSALMAGFWIVEGFAKFLEEGVYDIDRGTWSLFDRRAASLDTLASMGATGKIIDWKFLYGGTAVDYRALPQERDRVVRRRWLLGTMRMSTAYLWYVQSAATCQYLYHAENGRHRKALLEYVVNHYTRKGERMPIEKAFGMQPEELGRRVRAFAEAVANGWEPPAKKGAGNDGK